jgi:hypothetical protein
MMLRVLMVFEAGNLIPNVSLTGPICGNEALI